ncbi:MAG: hypothetical protein HZB39_17480 [Planctomycetes bacterium]|nr:hypothetical protein [Planctomycetota bacterium]
MPHPSIAHPPIAHPSIALPSAVALVLALGSQAVAQTGRTMTMQSPPRIGAAFAFGIAHPVAAAGNPYAVLWSAPYAGTSVPSIPGVTVAGAMRVDPLAFLAPFAGVFSSAGVVAHSLQVANDPALVGYAFDLQGVDLDATNGVLSFCDDELALVVFGVRVDWERRYEHGIAGHDSLRAIDADASGCVATGSSNGYIPGNPYQPYSYEIVTLRWSAAGALLWERRYNSPGSGFDDAGVAVDLAADGSVTVLGQGPGASGDQDVILIRYDASGAQQWLTRWSHNWSDSAVAMAIAGDGTIYVLASTYNAGSVTDIALLAFAPTGTLTWSRFFHGGYGTDVGVGLALDSLGNIDIGGYTVGPGGGTNLDWLALEYDPSGNLLWSRTVVGSPTLPDYCWGMTVGPNDDVLLTGTLAANPSGYCAASFDGAGNHLWTRALGVPGGAPYCEIRGDAAGNVYFASSTSVGSLDAGGNPRWQRSVSGQARALELDALGRVFVTSSAGVAPNRQQFVFSAFDALGASLGGLVYGAANDDEFAPRGLVAIPGAVYAVGSSSNGHDNDGYAVRLTIRP